MIGDPEASPPGEAPPGGHVVPTRAPYAGPIVDRVWLVPTKPYNVPTPSRSMPSDGYPRPTRKRLGALGTAAVNWLPFLALAAIWAGAAAYGARRVHRVRAHRGRLHGPREITDAATLRKRLAAFNRRALKDLTAASDGRDIDQTFLKLRRRLDEISRDSAGFFPEANDMNDEALRALIAAREAAKAAYREDLDVQRRRATVEAREARRRARPWET